MYVHFECEESSGECVCSCVPEPACISLSGVSLARHDVTDTGVVMWDDG